jgi:hypothetical protein
MRFLQGAAREGMQRQGHSFWEFRPPCRFNQILIEEMPGAITFGGKIMKVVIVLAP